MNTTYYVAGIPYSAELYHHGIKGQKWGIRRFQNEDGTLTAAGQKRYKELYEGEGLNIEQLVKKKEERVSKLEKEMGDEVRNKVTEKMFKVLNNIYEGDYTGYSGKHKEEYTRIVNEGEKISEQMKKKYREIEAREIQNDKNVKGFKRLFSNMNSVDHIRERNKKVQKELEKTKEYSDYKKWNDKYNQTNKDTGSRGYLSDLRKKMGGEWKDKTINQILKEVPESKKDAVWEYLRFNYWDYD